MSDKIKPSKKIISKNNSDKALTTKKSDEYAPDEILEHIPESDRGLVKSLMSMQFSSFSGPPNIFGAVKLVDKFNDKHVNAFLKHMNDDSIRKADDKKHKRKFSLIILIVSMVAFFGVCVVFKSNDDIIFKLIEFLIIAAGTGFGGWGLAKHQSSQ